jgi:hypothetical protein
MSTNSEGELQRKRRLFLTIVFLLSSVFASFEYESELEPVRQYGSGPAGPAKIRQDWTESETGPDETGFLPVHNTQFGTCIKAFLPTKTAFVHFLSIDILCQMLFEVQNKGQRT